MIRIVIFDMAGTAINEHNLVYKTLHESLNDFDVPCSLNQVLEWGAGHEKRDAISILVKKFQPKNHEDDFIDKIFNHFKILLNLRYDTEPMALADGMEEVMQYLRKEGIKIAFNTGYQRNVAQKILDRINIKEGSDIDLLVTADMVENGRPAPDMILKILEQYDIKPMEAIKIGDSKIDIEEGKNAGVKYSLGITTGAHTREQLMEMKPDRILDAMDALIHFIDEQKS